MNLLSALRRGPWSARLLWLAAGVVLGLGLAAALVALSWGWPRLVGPGPALPEAQVARLEALGRQALETEDIPVAALLVYRGEVIGAGHNTVRAHHDAGGHAEIQAISEALRRYGEPEFFKLERGEMELITTFEPCPMCQGAIAMYGIGKVTYLGSKPLGRHLELEQVRLRYLWTRRWVRPEDLQQRLFELHPSWPKGAKAP